MSIATHFDNHAVVLFGGVERVMYSFSMLKHVYALVTNVYVYSFISAILSYNDKLTLTCLLLQYITI